MEYRALLIEYRALLTAKGKAAKGRSFQSFDGIQSSFDGIQGSFDGDGKSCQRQVIQSPEQNCACVMGTNCSASVCRID